MVMRAIAAWLLSVGDRATRGTADLLRVLLQYARAVARLRFGPAGTPLGQHLVTAFELQPVLRSVDRYQVAFFDESDGTSGRCLRSDVADHQAVTAAGETAISDESDRFPQALADECTGRSQHLPHARPADRAFVTDHYYITRLDLLSQDRLQRLFLAFEHAGRSGDAGRADTARLGDRSFGSQVAAQDRQVTFWRQRFGEGQDHLLAGRRLSRDVSQVLSYGTTGNGQAIAVQQTRFQQHLHDLGDAAGLMEVRSNVAAAGFQVADQGRPAPDLLEVIDAQLDAEDRKSTRLNSSHVAISYAVFCLKKK